MDYSEQNLDQVLINNSYSTLRNKVIFSLNEEMKNKVNGKPDSRVMTDLLIYFMSVEQQELYNHPDLSSKYNGFFTRSCSQIEKENFITPKTRLGCMKELKSMDLIDYTRYSNLNGVMSIKVNKDNIVELINKHNFGFELYHTDLKKEQVQKCENRKKNYEEHMDKLKEKRTKELQEVWSVINQYRYKPLLDLQLVLDKYGHDSFDSILISFISKGLWKYKHQIIEWTEYDLNLLRKVVSIDREFKKTRKDQTDYFDKYGNYQKIIDCCKKEDRLNSSFNWSFRYGVIYENTSFEPDYRKGNFFLEKEQQDYFVNTDLTEEVMLNE